MEQSNNIVTALLQTAANTAELPKTGKNDGADEFQKLLEEKSQAKDPLTEERPRTEKPAEAKKPVKADGQKKLQDPAEQSKEAAMQGLTVVGTAPEAMLNTVAIVKADLVDEGVGIPVGDGWVLVNSQQLQTAIDNGQVQPEMQEGTQTMDVSDPEADAMLEATAPGADNSPAAMLEKVVAEQTGQEIQPEAGEAQPQAKDGDGEVELLEVEQAPQRVFHDVEAAPVKVGEVYDARQTDEADVVKQVDTRISQALQDGESLVRIQLTPENLGSVTVEISQSADGILHVALNARSGETRSLLERHAGDLQGLLSSRGQQDVQVEVQRQSESQQNQNQQHQNYDGRNGHAQDGQERRQSRREHTSSQDFMQQLRLGLIPMDGEDI